MGKHDLEERRAHPKARELYKLSNPGCCTEGWHRGEIIIGEELRMFCSLNESPLSSVLSVERTRAGHIKPVTRHRRTYKCILCL